MTHARTVAATTLLAALLVGVAAAAQEPCEDAGPAEASYLRGRFVEALERIEECLSKSASLAIEVRVRALRAKVFLAQDDLPAARQAVAELLRLRRDYTAEPLDPPLFVQLVAELQRHLRLSAIQVSSVSKIPENLTEAPAIVTVYTREDLERLAPRTLSELLQLTTGFLVERDNDDVVWGARGVVTDNNQKYLVAVDGHRITNNHNFGVNPFHQTRNLIEMAERIEIVRGSSGLFWGPDAFLGLINIVTRRPVGEERTLETRLTWGPTDETVAASATYLTRPSENTSLAMFVDALSSRGEEIRTDLAGQAGFDTVSGTFSDRVEPPSFSAHARFEGENFWLAGNFLRFERFVEGVRSTDLFRQIYVEAGTKRTLRREDYLSFRVYADDYNAIRRSRPEAFEPCRELGLPENRCETLVGQLFEITEQRIGFEALYRRLWSDRLASVVGWDARWYDYDGGQVGGAFDPMGDLGTATAVGNLLQNGWFGQLTGRFGRLRADLGGRFDRFDLETRDRFRSTPDESIGNSLLSWRLALGYRGSENLYFKAIASRSSLRPSWSQLSASFSFDSTVIDRQLRDESLRSVELNAGWTSEAWDSSLSIYRTRVFDTINAVTSEDRGFGFQNHADYETIGLESESRFRRGEDQVYFLNLTYYFQVERREKVRLAEICEGGGVVQTGCGSSVIPGTDRPYNIPDWFLRAGTSLAFDLAGRRLRVSPVVRYTGDRKIQALDATGSIPDRDVDALYFDLAVHLALTDAYALELIGRNVLDDNDIVGIGSGEAGFVIPKGATWEVSFRAEF